MQQTLEDLAAQNTAFKQAFEEEAPPPRAEDAMTEDERFGIAAEDGQSDSGAVDSGADGVAVVVEAEDDPAPPEATPEATAEEGATPEGADAMAAAEGEGSPMGEAVAEAPPAVPEPAAEASQAAEPPRMSFEEAVQKLSEDFGSEFIDMIRAIAAHEAGNAGRAAAETAVGSVRGEVDEAIDAINQAFATAHFEAIQEAHEDFLEIVATPEFQAWIDGMDPARQEQAKGVIAGGTARQVIRLLREFKSESGEQTDPSGMDELAAAAGIRSTGGGGASIPAARGGSSDEYADAWAKA